MAFADDGNRLVSAGDDRTVRVFELRQPNAPPKILPKAESSLYAVAFAPDGHRVASGSQSGVVTFWDLRRLKAPLKLLSGKQGDVVLFVAFARDGNRNYSIGNQILIYTQRPAATMVKGFKGQAKELVLVRVQRPMDHLPIGIAPSIR